jgi:hypothetical protein
MNVLVATLALGLRPRQGGCKVAGQERSPGVTSHALGSVRSVREWTLTVVTLALGSWPRQGVGRVHAKRETRESLHMLPGMQRVWGNEPSHSQVNSHVGSWSPKRTFKSSKRLHCPFGHLKHKLWPKERPRVKLAVWFPTTKSQESTQFPCVQVTCDIPLESSRGLQLCFRPYCNWRFAQKITRLQSCESPSCQNFGTSTWESRDKKVIWMWPPWKGTEYTIRGKVVASPKSGLWWVLCVRVARGSS